MLDVSRIARGQIQLQREPVDLPDVIAKAAELARPLLDEKAHRLLVDVPPGLVVSGDSVRLTQVMSNLLNNAAKYTDPSGLVEVSAAREGDRAVIRVKDNGIGISPEVLPRVFDMFVQEPQAIDRTKGGLGLGLAIVRTLVQAHGGTVTACSDGVGCGTELRVELPALPAGTRAVARAATLEAHPLGRNARRLLVVDDNADAAELLSESLTLLGYEAHRAHDAESALLLAGRGPTGGGAARPRAAGDRRLRAGAPAAHARRADRHAPDRGDRLWAIVRPRPLARGGLRRAPGQAHHRRRDPAVIERL